MKQRRSAVIGLGLIGASLAGALKQSGDFVSGFDIDTDTLAIAADRALVDSAETDLDTAVRDAAVIVLAVPLSDIIRLLPVVDELATAQALILDVGSVKEPVIRAMDRLPGAKRAIGGHPLAGKETAGPAAADATLFRNRPFVLVPGASTSVETIAAASRMVTDVGATPSVMSPVDHDRTVARTSHLPQLLSTALALSLETGDSALAGPGLRDMTRLAGSPWTIWSDIVSENASNIVDALDRYVEVVLRLRALTQTGSLDELALAMDAANGAWVRVSEAVPA